MNKIKTTLLSLSATLLFFQSIAQTDTLSKGDSLAYKPKLAVFIPAAVAITYGFVALNSDWLRQLDNHIYQNTNKKHPGFNTPADDYLRYVPVAAVYGLDLMGIKGKNNFRDKTALFFISSLFTNATVNVLKRSSNRMRPNHYNDYSFPSGHTATAFAAAEFLHREYGEQSLWISIAGYTVASTTGVFRLYRNYHWFSDVVAGAGIGILSTKLAYLAYPPIKKMIFGKKQSNFSALPFYQDKAVGLAIAGKF